MLKPKGYWKEFTGQPLQTGDLLFLGSRCMAFVGSKYTTNEPSTIEPMPSHIDRNAWSFDFDNGAINDRTRNKNGDAFISNSGWIYRSKEYSKILGQRVDRITWIYRLKP